MQLSDIANKVVRNALMTRYNSIISRMLPEPIDIKTYDFDGTIYHISNVDNIQYIRVSIKLNCYSDLQEHGVLEFIKKEYGPLLVATEAEYNVSLMLDISKVPIHYEELVRRVSLLKRNCFASVLEKYLSFKGSGSDKLKQISVSYRSNEVMYVDRLVNMFLKILPSYFKRIKSHNGTNKAPPIELKLFVIARYMEANSGRSQITFSMFFRDDDEYLLASIFLKEFIEGRRVHPHAPKMTLNTRDPSEDLMQRPILEEPDNRLSLTIELTSDHTQPDVRNNSIDLIYYFRYYLHCQIILTRIHLHTFMRKKTEYFLKEARKAQQKPMDNKRNDNFLQIFRWDQNGK